MIAFLNDKCTLYWIYLEFGSALLEKNQSYEAEYATLLQRIQAREAEIEQMRVELEEQEHVNRLLKYQMVWMILDVSLGL